ncbi:Ig-like domain-containing protein, partial [Psychrobacter sp. Rd 27.2]|uniref:Ig-like domain-containing protein n=1 Tax=Psychrobacter sp. Rd 27.2 TaxID=1926479 RepID=UPI00096889CE
TPDKLLFQAVKSVITPGGSTEVVATVKDKNDVPVEGQTVVFSRSADSSAGRLSAATAVTNSRGEARVVYTANASTPINKVVINARLLDDKFNIPAKTTTITE